MGKLTKLNKDLFNLKNIKEVIKKSVPVVGLTAALLMGNIGLTVGLTGCKDVPCEPEEPTIEQPDKKPTEKPEEKDHCGICEGIQGENHEHCKEEGCEKEGEVLPHTHDFCGECEGDQTKDHGHCNIEGCEKNGVYDDYANEHGDTHIIGGQEIIDTCNCAGTQDENHAHCTEPGCEKNGVYDDYANEHGDAHDYCGKCDGDQTKDHGHCTEPGCEKNGVYDDYANEHGDDHDYCNDCDGNQTDPNHTCPPATDICDICEGTQTDASHYFHVETIGGEGSAYKVAYPDFNKYFDDNYDVQAQRLDPQKMMQDFQDNYKNYINSLEFSDKFKAYCADKGYQTPADIDFKTFDEYTTGLSTETTSYKNNFDYLIGSTTDDYNKSINDICKPIFKDITQNIMATSDNPELDKAIIEIYYKGIKNEARERANQGITGNSNESEEYTNIKNNEIKIYDGYIPEIGSFYQTVEKNGETVEVINPEVAKQMDLMLKRAADNMGIELNDARNMFNLSYTMEPLEKVHDHTINFGHTDVCCSNYTNVMLGIIKNTEIEQ